MTGDESWNALKAAGIANPAAGGVIKLGRPTRGGGLYVHHTSAVGYCSMHWADDMAAALAEAYRLAQRLGAIISPEVHDAVD